MIVLEVDGAIVGSGNTVVDGKFPYRGVGSYSKLGGQVYFTSTVWMKFRAASFCLSSDAALAHRNLLVQLILLQPGKGRLCPPHYC